MQQPIFIIFASAACLLHFSEPANILGFFPGSARSHYKPFEQFFKQLAYRGHNVTVVNVFPSNEQISNFTEIILEKKPVGKLSFAETRKQYRIQNWIYMHDSLNEYFTYVGRQRQIKELLKSNDTKFDLVFMELYHMDSFYMFGHRFDCPIIGVSFQPLISTYDWILKNPIIYTHVPHLFLPYTDEMNFIQRFYNSAFHLFILAFYYAVSLPTWDVQSRQLWELTPAKELSPMPPYEEMVERLSMIFVETHFSAGNIRPNFPNVIEVGGIHIRDAESLPKDIQEFMDTSNNGVLFVSLGTLINPEDADELGKKLFAVIKKLPYRVIWKWKTNVVSDLSSKIRIQDWLPQQDILNHPNCKLFISHGGYHSILETIHAGVPMLGIPFFTDQHHNTALIEKFGIGLKISPESDQESIEISIRTLFNDKKYRQNCQYQSRIFKDRPMSSMETAIYWTEYVLRYKGAPHLKSAATKLFWFQYFGLDLLVAWLALIGGLVYLIILVKKLLYSLCAVFGMKNQNKMKVS